MAETARIFIDGEAGTTGLGIRERLSAIPGVELRSLTGDSRKDPVARRAIMEEVDLVVLCLPDAAAKESAELADSLGAKAPKLLDASTAHRVAPGWTYGFPELEPEQAAHIARARTVSNPGCYPRGAAAVVAAHDPGGGPAFELYGLGLEHKHVPEPQAYARLTRRPLFAPSVG